MNIECPNCHAAYDVPDSRLGTRRAVRCGACGHAWPVDDAAPVLGDHAAPAPGDYATPAPGDAALPGSPAPPPPEGADEPQAPAAGRLAPPRPDAAPRDALLTGAWVASVLLMIGMATAAYAWRGNIAAAWPPAGHILGAPTRTAMVTEPVPPGTAGTPAPSAATRQYTSTDAKLPSPAR